MKRSSAFSLVELMVAMAVTALLVTLLANIGDSASQAWQRGSAQAESYSMARGAMSNIGRELEGAVIDLDIGFWVEPVSGESGNFVLKFLRRRDPDGATGAVAEKTAYQLAWASRGLLPEVQGSYDDDHPVPVLIRTTSTDLSDLYEVAQPTDEEKWVRDWGVLGSGEKIKTGQMGGADGQTITEIAAENVLGWNVIPKYWPQNANATQIESDDPSSSGAIYYGKYLTSDKAPDALEVRLAVVPSQAVPQLSSVGKWGDVRDRDDLFDYTKFGDDVFDRGLKKHLRHFTTTFYLSSRTP